MSPLLNLPEWRGAPDDAARVAADISAWRNSDALHELVMAFGGSAADCASLAALDDFSAANWDFRSGLERDQALASALDADLTAAVTTHTKTLGLAGRHSPRHTHYDVAILTGGMVRAGLVKPRFVSELRVAGVRIDRVVFLGAHRAFSIEELALARSLGVPGNDEVDGMLEGIRRVFSFAGDPRVEHSDGPIDHASWGSWRWGSGTSAIGVIAAPSADPDHRRANTADTFRFWADRFADAARSALVVTTPIYVPYQAAVAVETLGLERGMSVETVGVGAEASDLGAWTQRFTARHQLQELRSAIRSMASLERALQSIPASGR